MTADTRPPDYPLWVSQLTRFVMRLFGWEVVGHVPNYPKMVIIGAYHTSNWDGVLLLLLTLALRTRMHWIGKHTLFRPPVGWLTRLAGGIPVNRSTTTNAVEQVVQTFEQRDRLVVVLAPEGTRKKVDHWKTGFYYIALGAKVPIVLGYADYRRRRVGLGEVVIPSGDIEADMRRFRDFYTDVTPRHPEKKGDIALPPRSETDTQSEAK
jgi:1-acyl-sn-glycerol-3-phosphate acyltransferase